MRAPAARPPGRLRLLVLGEPEATSYGLPESGQVTLGRAAGSDIRIDAPGVAPAHAVLHVGEPLFLEDLGTGRSTRVGDSRLEPGARVRLQLDEPVALGGVWLVVQRRVAASAPARRIWSHGYFDSRLEEECLRSERSGTPFAVLRVRCEREASSQVIEETLANVLRLVDVVASYGPAEYEVLLPETPLRGAQLVAERIDARLSARRTPAGIGVASYPEDGRSADELSARVGAMARGEQTASSSVTAPPLGAMQQLHRLVARIATGTISVLILGETGVGKEKLAELIHQRSPRAKGPFLRLSCAALSESLLESELFGHERGAFTGAVNAKPGLLESAQGGTVFFDEVGEMPVATQVKLLRVIEERKATRVGGLKPYAIDVRFVSATNRDLESEVQKGAFREDLFFRLNGISVVIPPLRERLDEIEGLARSFVAEASRRNGRKDEPALSARALALLKRYRWPGNIRELRNVLERAVLLCEEATVTSEHLPVERLSSSFAPRWVHSPAVLPAGEEPRRQQERRAAPEPEPSLRAGARKESEGYERRRIQEALAACAGNQSAAAKRLGISRRTLLHRLDQYGMPRPRKGRRNGGG